MFCARALCGLCPPHWRMAPGRAPHRPTFRTGAQPGFRHLRQKSAGSPERVDGPRARLAGALWHAVHALVGSAYNRRRSRPRSLAGSRLRVGHARPAPVRAPCSSLRLHREPVLVCPLEMATSRRRAREAPRRLDSHGLLLLGGPISESHLLRVELTRTRRCPRTSMPVRAATSSSARYRHYPDIVRNETRLAHAPRGQVPPATLSGLRSLCSSGGPALGLLAAPCWAPAWMAPAARWSGSRHGAPGP
jgi:hypothetical protein